MTPATRRLTIEQRESGLYRLYNGSGSVDVMGETVEKVLRKGMEAAGISAIMVGHAIVHELSSTYGAADVLYDLMGNFQSAVSE